MFRHRGAGHFANLKFISVRDRLLADIPGIDDSRRDLLLGQTKQIPHWKRVERALDSDTEYRLAQLSDHLVSEGILSDWATGK